MTRHQDGYRFTTMEEIDSLGVDCGLDSEGDIYKMFLRLLAERDAFREVAARLDRNPSGEHEPIPANYMMADFEARRLLTQDRDGGARV